MVQDILTTIAIGGAGGYTIYSFIRTLLDAKEKKTGCSGCSGCSPKQHSLKLSKKIF